MEKKLSRKEIYDGKVINVVVDDVLLENGNTSKREVVLHRGGACIALKDVDDKFFMVKQYRYALGKEMLEFCAGKLEEGETPYEAIKREVEEELGYKAKNIVDLGHIIPTCGYCNEHIYLYYGEVDVKTSQHLDEDEDLSLCKYSFKEIKKMIQEGIIDDSKTIALMYRMEMEGILK